MSFVRRFHGKFRWEKVTLQDYKSHGSHFRNVTRQVLFDQPHGLSSELRYFEVAPAGYTSLEQHRHPHAVMVLRGRGMALVGEEISQITPFDLIIVPPLTWHQFRALDDSPLGFLCLVDASRDRPIRPSDRELAVLRNHPGIGPFIRPQTEDSREVTK